MNTDDCDQYEWDAWTWRNSAMVPVYAVARRFRRVMGMLRIRMVLHCLADAGGWDVRDGWDGMVFYTNQFWEIRYWPGGCVSGDNRKNYSCFAYNTGLWLGSWFVQAGVFLDENCKPVNVPYRPGGHVLTFITVLRVLRFIPLTACIDD